MFDQNYNWDIQMQYDRDKKLMFVTTILGIILIMLGIIILFLTQVESN